MKGCSVHFHETLGVTEGVDTHLIVMPAVRIRNHHERIQELMDSIRAIGLVQPIVVRPMQGHFEIVAGARRFEACKKLRWAKVPCIIRELSDREAFEFALVENIQRNTMNVMEEAMAFKRYISREGWGSESVLARRIGKSQEYVSHRLSLLSLPTSVRERIAKHQITPSMAGEILRLAEPATQIALSEVAARDHLTVKVVRRAVRSIENKDDVEEAVKTVRNEENRPPQMRLPGFQFPDVADPTLVGPSTNLENSRSEDSKRLENVIIILKLALFRLSYLFDDLSKEDSLWDTLDATRVKMHTILDSLVKTQVEMRRSVFAEVKQTQIRRLRAPTK